MKRIGPLFVIAGLMAAAFPSGASDANLPKGLEEYLLTYDRADVSQATVKEYQISVQPGEQIVYDWATGTMGSEPQLPASPDSLTGGAGCVFLKPPLFGITWARDPVGLLNCPHQFLFRPISTTVLACIGALGFCLADGLNIDFFNFGFFLIFCSPEPGAVLHSWVGGPSAQTFNCFVLVFGSNPNTWTLWDSICFGNGGVGLDLCFHKYR